MSLKEINSRFLFKYIIIGDSFVGKSKILLRYVNNTYNENFVITIGAEFGAKTINIDDQEIRIQIWDTAGMENFKSITRSYYKNSLCAIIVYDITNKDSFKNVLKWIEDCKNFSPKEILFVLIGNKCDLSEKREVNEEEGKKIAKEYNMIFFETSAKDNINISELFLKSAQIILENVKNKVYDDVEELNIYYKGNKLNTNNNNNDYCFKTYCCSNS
jgi:small GTP-binding protein